MMLDLQQSESVAHDPFELLDCALAAFDSDESALQHAAEILTGIQEAAECAAHHEAAGCTQLLVRLLEMLEQAGGPVVGPAEMTPVLEFVRQSAAALREDLEAGTSAAAQEIAARANERWGDWLALVAADDEGDYGREIATDEPPLDAQDGPEAEMSPADVARLLGALQEAAPPENTAVTAPHESAAVPHSVDSPAGSTSMPSRATAAARSPAKSDAPLGPAPADLSAEIDPELLEPYLEDTNRCLASMEAAMLEFEQAPQDPRPLRTVCRDLHTLKGASATVGLSALADELHELEEQVQGCCDPGGPRLDAQVLLAAVDDLRRQLSQLGSQQAAAAAVASPPSAVEFAGPTPGDEETLRVRGSQLDRLMDMLAELIMLRNRRDSRVGELGQLNEKLVQCATQLRLHAESPAASSITHFDQTPHVDGGAEGAGTRAAPARAAAQHPVHEVATDILEIARSKKAVCNQIADEDLAVSGIIRDFRQELMQLRRLPVSGLFRRLQRAVRDAARVTGRQVRFEMKGEHAGLERSLQERLYEPLLHIVRNAVSHGIEPAEVRQACGKDPVGTVTLEARGGTSLLVLEVRDDGQGLDYDAVRRRAVQRGLLAAEQPASREELARLIFHPGFSTRDQVDGVAGRGVGMDVVAETLSRMRSWVEVDSTPGQGTHIRLSVPLRSVIEHTMVFAAADQLFAVPMQFVHNADGPERTAAGTTSKHNVPAVEIGELLNARVDAGKPRQRLLLGHTLHETAQAEGTAAKPGRFELLVDKIVGPEEVVVRPLPPLLRHHQLFSGVTLSGAGDLVLLFDSRCLIELALSTLTEGDSLE